MASPSATATADTAQHSALQHDVSPGEVRAMLSDYARMLMLRGERTVLLRKEALTALERLAGAGATGTGGSAARGGQTHGTAAASGRVASQGVAQHPPAPSLRAAERSPAPQAQPQSPQVPLSPVPRAALAPEGGSKVERLEALRNIVAPCRLCEHLAVSRTQTVFGVGNPECEIMFVGEAPGADEDKKGEPFVGAAGQLLTKMIGAMKLSRDDVYIANVLKCRPDMPSGSSGNRKPTPAEMKTCLPYLKQQIAIIKPKVLVALGLTAIEGLRGLAPGTVTLSKMRGTFTEFEGIPLMPTFHPAYLLRNQSITEKRKAWEDLMQVMEKIGMPIDERQRNFFLAKG